MKEIASFFRKFYGITEEKEKKEKGVKPKFSWSEFYDQKKFTIWKWFSFAVCGVTGGILGCSAGNLLLMIAFLLLYIGVYSTFCSRIYERNRRDKNTNYEDSDIFLVWMFITWAIYCACGLLFVDKSDLIPLHKTGLIVGTVASVIFTFFLPPISYAMKLNQACNYVPEERKLEPTKGDKRMHAWLMLIVAAFLSLFSSVIIIGENNKLESKKKELQLEQMDFEAIVSKDFTVEVYPLGNDKAFALVETKKGIVAVNMLDYPEVCTATKVKVMVNGTVIINGKRYLYFDKIKFETETPAPE